MDGNISQIRSALEGKTLLIVPYMHGDWAWCHTRQWHALRYISVLEDVVKLLEEHPEYNYKWYMDCYVTVLKPLLDRKPQMIDKLKKHIKAGNIAICGGFSNVRPNMVGDEAYIRNMVYGRKRFRACFPDSEIIVQAEAVDTALGHPQIPQLIKKGGFKYYRAGRPFDILADKGLPRAFVWEGIDGTQVPVWWGDYGGMWTEGQVKELNRVGERPWEEFLEMFYDTEMVQYIKTSKNKFIWVGQGCDDCLPLQAYNSDLELKLPEIIEKWNRYEKSELKFSTPDEFFRALDSEIGSLSVYKGTIDICDVCYNIAWGGEKGLIALRLTGSDQLAAAEIWSASAALTTGSSRQNAESLWEDLLTANAHATSWLFQKDFDRIYTVIRRAHSGAEQMTEDALKQIASKIEKPENTVTVIFNPCGIERYETVRMTLPCGYTDDLELYDGTGAGVDYQIVYPYEFGGMVWENEAVLRIKLPPFGYTTISAKNIAVDSRLSKPYTAPAIKEKKLSSESFCLHNGILRLDFENGSLIRIFDAELGMNVRADCRIPWNTLRFSRIDTDSYGLHAGPVTEETDAVFDNYTITENGPVCWRVVLSGKVGLMPCIQTITLTAGSRSVEYAVDINFTENRGRLSCGIPVTSDCDVWGGIPFGIEKKDVTKEKYTGDGWENFHRMYKGLFFSKDFSAVIEKDHIVSLRNKTGDRFFIYDTEKNELFYILTNSAHMIEDSWECSVNKLVEFSGDHHFEYSVSVDKAGKPLYKVADEALAYRMAPVLVEPYGSTGKGTLPPHMSFFSSKNGNIRITAAYSDGDAYIIRLFEADGRETDGEISLPAKAVSCMSEDFIGNENGRSIKICGETVMLTVKPYEIITLRIRFE